MSACKGTFMLHAIAILYTRWQIPEPRKTDGTLAEMERKLSVNVQKDLTWLDSELKAGGSSGGIYLVDNRLTAADIMMAFSIRFILTRKLGTGEEEEDNERWKTIRIWLENVEAEESYKRAVEKTGYSL